MKVTFSRQFEKQLDDIKDASVKVVVSKAIQKIIAAPSLKEISGLKKMKGHKIAYRLRTGDYRIGFFFENGEVFITAFAHRKDIYKHFP